MPSSRHRLVTALQLGAVLQASRKKQRMTQAALAGRLGLSQPRVSHLESNPQDLSVRQLLAWCAALGLELGIGERGGNAAPGDRAAW